MSFRQFAYHNVKRNAPAYSAYFLSSSFAVMIFFTYAMFIFHPDLAKSELGISVQIGMKSAEYVVFVFSFLFVLYSISAFLKARKKEFGILTILGAESRQLNRLIFLENMIIGATSIFVGIVSGMLLSKLFLLVGAKVVDMEELAFYLPVKAIGLTAGAFFVLFFTISLFTVFFIRQNKVLELLLGTSKPKTDPKASILLSILSIASFVGVYYLLKKDLTTTTMLLILFIGCVGTYFLFTQLSVFIIHLLKKNRHFFWRNTNLLWVSEMAYKMKDNARMFFMVTIVTAMACTAVGVVLGFKQTTESIYTDEPFAITYLPFETEGELTDLKKIEQELRQANISYQKLETVSTYLYFKEAKPGFRVMSQSNFEKMVKVLNWKTYKLKPNEAVLIASASSHDLKNLNEIKQLTTKNGNMKFQVKERLTQGRTNLVIVADDTYKQLLDQLKDASEETEVNYFIPEWNSGSIPQSKTLEVQIGQKLTKENQKQREQGDTPEGLLVARGADYIMMKQATNAMSFIGVFIAAIFSVSTASFLYFKLYTDLNQDRKMYHSLSKIGLSEKEMKRAATIQIAILFFAPLVVASLQVMIGLAVLRDQYTIIQNFMPVLTAVGAFFLVQFVYFWIVRSRYLAQLKQMMV